MEPKTALNCEHLKKLVREVPDFPKPGILFYALRLCSKIKPALPRSLTRFPNTILTMMSTWCWALKRAALSLAPRWRIA